MEFTSSGRVRLDKPLNELDRLVLRFLQIIQKYVEYVIISGYVAILFGRSRGTEDVDVFIRPISKDVFGQFYQNLKAEGFWCLNAESEEEVYSYLQDGLAVRFALNGEAIPNFEVKFAIKRIDTEVFEDFLEVELPEGIIKVSSPERQIAFKRYYLKSEKDLEDARHIEEIFKEHINKEKIKKYKELIILAYGKT